MKGTVTVILFIAISLAILFGASTLRQRFDKRDARKTGP